MDLALIVAAFIAGVLMFLAPCTLPIVPGYLAFISGVPDSRGEKARRRILTNALAFVVGFSAVYIVLGLAAGTVGVFVGPWKESVSRIGGVIILLFGLTMLGIFRLPFLSKESHIAFPKFISIGRWQSSFLIGMLFAVGWSPCTGPILATILYTAQYVSVWQGGILLGVFSLGFGIPFLLTALLMETGQNMFGKWGTTSKILSVVGGIVLILVGLLMLTDNMALLVEWGFRFFEGPYNQLLKYM